MKNKGKNRNGVVYSTNSNYSYNESEFDEITLPNNKQNLQVCIDKHRGGKIAIIIKDFIGNQYDLKELSKKIKSLCGVGGTAKKGEIIIQGNVRDKIMEILKKEGYNYKRVGG